MAVRKIAHPSIDERKAEGKEARDPDAAVEPLGVAPGGGPPRSGRAAGGAERHPGAGPGAGAARPDDGLAVHLLPGRGQDHGRRPDGHPGRRAGRPAVRRRPPVELRRVRLARAAAAVRPERLRRDAAGAVRVRREADGGELHDRGPQQRVRQGGRARGDAGVGDGLPGGDGRVRADADDGHLVRPPGRGRAEGRDPQHGGRRHEGQGGQGGEEGEAGKERRAAGEAGQAGREAGGEEPPRRRTPGTACRRCPSWASWSTAGTGSSASRRSSSRSATGPPPTGCPPTRSRR